MLGLVGGGLCEYRVITVALVKSLTIHSKNVSCFRKRDIFNFGEFLHSFIQWKDVSMEKQFRGVFLNFDVRIGTVSHKIFQMFWNGSIQGRYFDWSY